MFGNLLRRTALALALLALAANGASAQQDMNSGNYLLEVCRAVAVQQSTVPWADSIKAGICIGRLEALAWIAPEMTGALRSCPPAAVNNSQLAKVVVSYMDRHPAHLHEIFLGLSLSAFHEAWPCAK
jgi:Rap1a immunity proteins